MGEPLYKVEPIHGTAKVANILNAISHGPRGKLTTILLKDSNKITTNDLLLYP